MAVRNAFDRFVQQAVSVLGTLTGSATTPTLSNLSGDLISDQGNVTTARSAAGVYTISVTNFRGQRLSGTTRLNAVASGTTISNMVSVTSMVYTASTDTAVFTFRVVDDTGTAQDNGFNFHLFAY